MKQLLVLSLLAALAYSTEVSTPQVRTGGLSGLLDEALALLHTDKLKVLIDETSREFKNSKEVQSLFQKLRDHGIDVDKFVQLVAGFFGWGILW